MRLATCTLPDGGTIAVQSKDAGRVFHGGDRIDLDAIAVAADGARRPMTWGEVLGHHVEDHFTVERQGRARADQGSAADAVSVAQEE